MRFAVVLLCCALLVKGQDPGGDVVPTSGTVTNSTTAPTTTTTEATTTSKETTTTVSTTSTSGTTTTAKPTDAPTPSPEVPDYPKNINKWSVEDEKNSSCIALKCAMQITVIVENRTETLNVPPFAEASGSCTEPQMITLTWNSDVPNEQNSLSFTFGANHSKENSLDVGSGITLGKYAVQNVQAALYLNSTNATTIQLTDIDVFQTPLNHSYSCLAEEQIKSKGGNFVLKIREVQLEAYRLTPPGHREFSAAVQCSADDATDVVPIAVGAALAGLVVIVLIAYLIGRKRSRARGYQSV